MTMRPSTRILLPLFVTDVPIGGSRQALAKLEAKLGIPLASRENAIAPGPTDTDLFRNGKSEQLIQYFRNLHPMKRIGEVDEIAPIVAFLSREEAGWVNGQTHFVNGVSYFVGLYAYRR